MPSEALLTLLRHNPAWLDGTDAEVAALANAPSIERPNTTRIDYIGIAAAYGAAKVDQLDEALTTAGRKWVQNSLGSRGLDFSHAETIAAIQGLRDAGLVSAPDAAALLALGVTKTSPFNDAGGTGAVTTDHVAEARAYLATQALLGQLDAITRTVHGQVVAGQVATLAELKAALSA